MSEHKRMKKVFSILLCLCMVLTHVPTTAFAAEGDPVCTCQTKCAEVGINGECAVCSADGADLTACIGKDIAQGECGADGSSVQWALDDSGTLTISGTGAMADYEIYANRPWHDVAATVTSVFIAEGVTSIGVGAFKDFSQLRSITIPASVKSLGDNAFASSGLEEITFAEGSLLTTIGGESFWGCGALKQITLPAGVTTIGDRVFVNCSALTDIFVAAGSSTYKDIDGVLYTADGKTLVYYSLGRTAAHFAVPEGVTTIGKSAFSFNANVTTITLPNGMTSIGEHAFDHCVKLTSINIPEGVTSIGESAFNYCPALSGITIPEGVTRIAANMFNGCAALTEITIPEGVVSIGDYAFDSCEKLTTVTIPKSVTSIGDYAFEFCSGLTTVSAPCNWNSENPLYRFESGVTVNVPPHTGNAVCEPTDDGTKHIATYDCCGSAVTEDHTMDSTTGKCTECSEQAVAKIGDTYYLTLAQAAASVTEDSNTIDVFTDVIIGADETVTFAAFAKLNVAEGKTVTCNGTVKIGEKDGIIFENTLYYHGGNVTNEGNFVSEDPAYFTAGSGYIIAEMNSDIQTYIVEMVNATVNREDGCGILMTGGGHSDEDNLHVKFSGTNTITVTGEYESGVSDFIRFETAGGLHDVTISGADGAVLNISTGDATQSSRGIRAKSVTITGGTVNITTGNSTEGGSFGIEASSVTVEEGATLNLTVGKAAVAVGINGLVSGAGTVNGLIIVPADNALGMSFATSGDTVLIADFAIPAEELIPFTVPEGTTLTVNEGVTLDLSDLAVADIDFSGTVVNNGTILLPEGFVLDNAPKSGTVKIGEKSYTWDSENNKWICGENSHTGGTATCVSGAICDTCGTSYGELDSDNHASAEFTYTAHEDGTTHKKAHKCCDATAVEAEAHTGEATYTPNADDRYAHDVTWSCCGGVITEFCHDLTDTVSPDGATCTFACGFCKRPIETWTIVAPVCTVYGDGNSCEATVLLDGEPVEGSIVFTYYQQVNDGWSKLEAAPTNAGTYRAEVVLIDGADYGENDVIIHVEYTIAKGDPEIGTVGCDMKLYDSTDISTVVLTRTNATVDGTLVLMDTELTVGVGAYRWQFTPKNTENYNTITGTVILNVTKDVVEKIEASGTLTRSSYVYGDILSVEGLTVTAIYTSGATKDVTTDVSFDSTLAAGQTSVVLTYQGRTCEVGGITVAKKQLAIEGMSWNVPENAIYNGTEYSVTLNGTLPTGVVATLSGHKATNAGDYTAKAAFSLAEGYSADNYEIVNGAALTADWTIAKAKLTITADSKVIYIGERLPTLTYTVSGLAGSDELIKEAALTTNADADQAGSYTVTVADADAGDNYTITYVSGSLTVMDKETKIEQTKLTEVPDGLKDTQIDTVEEITEALISKILATSTGYAAENMVHYDVTLRFSLDGGDSWILATEENFPTEGITVVLPYPEGTNPRDYEFVVSHMFTVTSQRLGTTAGDVELPEVVETEDGIRVTLNGLSPVTVAARYHDHTGGTATCSDKAGCSICGNAYGELDAANHAGGTEVKNDKEATCGTEGYTGDTCCKGCGVVLEKGTVIKATGQHSYGSWKVVTEATTATKGEKQRICTVCGDVDSEDIPMVTDNPATGDDSNMMLHGSLFTVSFAALAALLLADRKRKQENA